MSNSELITAVNTKRKQGGVSLRRLGACIGVSFSTLVRIERGDGTPALRTRIVLLEWIGVDASAERAQAAMGESPTVQEMWRCIQRLEDEVQEFRWAIGI